MASSRTELRDRRRRRRQDSEQEILDAAERLLRERPLRDLTIDDVMAATSQSRTAFYRHFTDRQELLIRLLRDMADELYEMAETWLDGGGDPLAECLQAVERLVGVYQDHGRLLRAIAEAASHDEEVERVYADLVRRFVAATEARMRRDQAAGRLAVADVHEVALALCWMTERYLTVTFGRPEPGDRATAVTTLYTIWVRALYGTDPRGQLGPRGVAPGEAGAGRSGPGPAEPRRRPEPPEEP